MNEKYKLNLEVIADTEEGVLSAVTKTLEDLESGATIRDITNPDGAYSYTLKHGVPENVLSTVRQYYSIGGRDRHTEALMDTFDRSTYFGKSVPPHLRYGLVRYVVEGTCTGDFLTACFENHLGEAIAHADAASLEGLPAVHGWMYNNIPTVCYGSYQDIQTWFEAHAIARAEAGR